jgi:dCTP deaminase
MATVSAARLADPAAAPGVQSDRAIAALIAGGVIAGDLPVDPTQIQPASLDLRLGATAWRVKASFLPGPHATVMEKVEQLDGYAIDLSAGAVLERGCVYVVPLMERLALPADLTALANPKSSTGRLDILVRLITDRGEAFDQIPAGYNGPLFAEIAPRTFSIVARAGSRLNQIRFRHGLALILRDAELDVALKTQNLARAAEERLISRGPLVGVTVDLRGTGAGSLIGYRARKHTDRIDVDRVAACDPSDFWEPIYGHRLPALVLNPDDFYILVTREKVRIPPDLAAEMVAYDTAVGEFRVHYAGFFDPGFGDTEGGARAVLEVRSHEVPFMLEHGQIVGWLQYERMAAIPDHLYGAGLGSNYQNQGLALAKQFRCV